ncbi:hypothetical protein OMD46_16715 [Pseudomonas sp. MDMC_285]|nr:hypothetical protein [Pseudomonas sp. MDMC_285]
MTAAADALEAPSLPAAGSESLSAVRCQCCATEYPHDSYDAGFIAGSGMCQVCDAAIPAKDLPAAGLAGEEVKVVAWVTPEKDRVITALTVAAAREDGGAMLSSVRPYSVPCMTVAQHERIVAALSAQQSAPERVSVPVELLQDLHDLASDAVEHHREAFAEYKLKRQANMDATVDKARAILESHAEGGKV